MRHDYDLPPDWDALSDAEKSKWMTQERCRRQSKRQALPTTGVLADQAERYERRLAARNETDPVDR